MPVHMRCTQCGWLEPRSQEIVHFRLTYHIGRSLPANMLSTWGLVPSSLQGISPPTGLFLQEEDLLRIGSHVCLLLMNIEPFLLCLVTFPHVSHVFLATFSIPIPVGMGHGLYIMPFVYCIR